MKQILFGTLALIAATNARMQAPSTLAQVNTMAETADVFSDIGDAFEDAGDWIVGAGEDIGDAFVDAYEWTDQAFKDAGEWTEQAFKDAGDWTEQAFNDAGKWFLGAGEDIGEWTVGAGEDIGEWFEQAAYDVVDWTEGAVNDVGDFATDIGTEIAVWTVDTAEDFGEFATDVFDKMGDFAEEVYLELEDMYHSVEDWSQNAIADVGRFAEDIGSEIAKLDKHFQALGDYAADLYKEAEKAVGRAAQELEDLADAALAECIKIGNEINKAVKQMEDWTNGALRSLEDAMYAAGRELEKLGNDIANSAAVQKTIVFLQGFVEECSKAGEHLYKSTAKIIDDIKKDGLWDVLADGIDHFGDTITHFTTETFLNEIGGTAAKIITIPLTTVMKGIGLEEEGNEMKEWIDNGLKGMSESLDKAMTDNFDLMSTLLRDPEEFAKQIEQEPWRIATMLNPIMMVPETAKFSWTQDQIESFAEFDSPDLKLPSGWISDI